MADTLDPQDPVATVPDDLHLIDTPPPALVPAAPATVPPVPAAAAAPTAAPAGVDPVLAMLPAGVTLAPVGKKFGAALLDGLFMMLTLYIGWLIWGAIVAGKGQTPGRQVLGLRVVSVQDGKPLGWASMVFLRGFVGGFVTQLAWVFTLGVLAFMPLWDRRNQTVTDKVSSSIVVDDPNKVYG